MGNYYTPGLCRGNGTLNLGGGGGTQYLLTGMYMVPPKFKSSITSVHIYAYIIYGHRPIIHKPSDFKRIAVSTNWSGLVKGLVHETRYAYD